MCQLARYLTARGGSLTLWLIGTALTGISCRPDDVVGPTEPGGPTGSAASLSTGATATPALSFRQVSSGSGAHTCGVTTDNRLYCWGFNSGGQLGDGTTTDRLTPVRVSGGLRFRLVSAGNGHTCGVTLDDRAYCWGGNEVGRLGDGTRAGRLTPVPVVGGLRFREVSAGLRHTCGLTTTNRLYCWGQNFYAQLGDGTTSSRLIPVAVSGGHSFRQVSVGALHSCGVTTSYRAFCWGYGASGRLGDGARVVRRRSPVAVAGALAFRQVTGGYYHTCAVTTGNRAFCWGHGVFGQIGDGNTLDRWTPGAVAGGRSFKHVSAGVSHTCGETLDNLGLCWGAGSDGQRGDGTDRPARSTPGAIAGGLTLSQLSSGRLHTCGKTPAGQAYCWGSNSSGQLGDGTRVQRLRPVPVAGSS